MHFCHQSLSYLYLVGTFQDLHRADLMVECQPSQQTLLWSEGMFSTGQVMGLMS